jgi:hypothetical protein
LNRPLTEIDIYNYAKKLKLCNFRGVFMRNNLPRNGPIKQECAVINLDSLEGPGTHWVAYYKKNSTVYYFDSFGNLRPPMEIVKYLGGSESKIKILYNYRQFQKFDTVICGHLCLKFLYNLNSSK